MLIKPEIYLKYWCQNSKQVTFQSKIVHCALCNSAAPLLFVSGCQCAEFSGGAPAKSKHRSDQRFEGKQILKAGKSNHFVLFTNKFQLRHSFLSFLWNICSLINHFYQAIDSFSYCLSSNFLHLLTLCSVLFVNNHYSCTESLPENQSQRDQKHISETIIVCK